jgi:uncharacterized protein
VNPPGLQIKPFRMSLKTARRLALVKQHLAGRRPKRPGPGAIMDLMKDLRYLQLDPTNIVAPSHLLVLWSRIGAFRETDLDGLLWRDKKLFEYWAHRASIVLTEDYPLYSPRMKSFYEGDLTWDKRLREWVNENKGLQDYIIGELKAKGPLPLREFEERSEGSWRKARRRWGLRPSAWASETSVSRMVQFLFHDGTIMVAGRQGRQKVWDLSERCLPPWTPKTELTEAEVEYDGAQKSLRALGVATPKQIAWHFLIRRFPNIRSTMQSLVTDSRVLLVELTDGAVAKGSLFIHADDVEAARSLEDGDWEPRTTLLSPFDNLIADRDRTLAFFGFFYRIEIYTPKEKRKHGFFVLPILDGDKLIGRLDPYLDRDKEELVIRAVHAEPGAPRGSAPAKRIAEATGDLAEFLGAKQVTYSGRVPEPWRGYLK